MKSKKQLSQYVHTNTELVFVISLQIVYTNTNHKEYKKFNDLTQILKCKTYNNKVQKKQVQKSKTTNEKKQV